MTTIIAGERSSAGKTTVTLALLASLKRRGLKVQSFKVGPDYIDPMFHQAVTGCPCRNLDPVLTSETYVQHCFASHSQKAPYSLVEGVMGLFDGQGGTDAWASTAHIARLLDLPLILVVDCSRLSHSIAALVHGYCSFDPRLQVAGVILNRVGSDRHLEILQAALEPLQITVLGVLRRQAAIAIPDRHLGLVPTDELQGLNRILDQLADLADQNFDWPHLLPLLQTKPQSLPSLPSLNPDFPPEFRGVRLAIARDPAFNFYYADNLDLLHQWGAELCFWSPLQDVALPEGVQGLYLGGGFPEMFAADLSNNKAVRQQVRQAIEAGMPTYAECGGLMYLCKTLHNLQNQPFPMVGVLPTTATLSNRLALGYRQAIAQQDTPLLPRHSIVWGHEFHRSILSPSSRMPLYKISLDDSHLSGQPEGWRVHQVHASYIHLHWGDRPSIPHRFLQFCQQWRSPIKKE